MSPGERLGTAPAGRLRLAAERAAAPGAIPAAEQSDPVDPVDGATVDAGTGDTAIAEVAQQSHGDGNVLVGGDLGGGHTQITTGDFAAVTYYLTSTSPPERAVRERPAVEVTRLRSMLVTPPGYDRALLTLHAHRRVLLVGRAGTGREAAGLGLLADTGGEADVAVVRDPTRAELDEYEFGAGCRVLVDLRNATGESADDPDESLNVLIGRVTNASGNLVLLSEPGLHTPVEESQGSCTCTIGAVSARDVLSAHLRGHGASSGFIAAVEESAAVQDFCHGARPGLAARLAVRLLGDPDGPADGSELTEWLARAVRTFTPFGNAVTVRFDAADRLWSTPASGRSTPGGPESTSSSPVSEADSLVLERSLLLSAALVENLSVSALQIEDILLDQLGRPTQAHPLGRVGFGVRLGRLDNVVRGDDGLVKFGQTFSAIELLCHVWANYPHLRSALLAWVRSIPDSTAVSLGREERFGVVEQFVKVCDRLNADGYVPDLVVAWASGRRESRLAAILALSTAALSWGIGRETRQRMYKWAKSESSSHGLQDVVLRTCAGPFAHSYPSVALTRLGHLAERPTSIGSRARSAIVELAGDEVVLPYVGQKLVEWFGRDSRRDLTLDLLDVLLSAPEWGLGTGSRGRNRMRASLVELTRQAFDGRGTAAAKRITAAFLEHAVRVDADATVALLADAARGSGLRLSRLAWGAAEWLTDDRGNVNGSGRRSLYVRVTASVDSMRSESGRHILSDPRRCGHE